MKRLILATAVLCGFLGNGARADHLKARGGVEEDRLRSGPEFPGGPHWTGVREEMVPRRPGGRFGRGRRFERALHRIDYGPVWGGPHPVPPLPEPQWPWPGVGLPSEGPAEFGYYRPGDFVQGPVPLYPRVRVKDRDEAAPHCITVVVAVADPNPCPDAFHVTGPSSVFVPICVPRCPLRDMKVDKGGSRIKLDYGEYTVELKSKDGVVTVDYDD